MGSKFLAGALILLTLIVIELVFTFINTGVVNPRTTNGCTTADNETVCGSVGQTNFYNSLKTTAVTGIDGAPDYVNTFWLIISAFVLALGIILMVLGVLGSVFGSG